MKIIIAGVLLATTLLFAVSCGKKCVNCGETKMGGEEILGVFICDDCISDIGNSLF